MFGLRPVPMQRTTTVAATRNPVLHAMWAPHPAVWNVPAVLRMLNNVGLSYKDPIALSDFLTTCDFVKGKAKPRRVSVSRDHTCLPCPGGQALCPCRLGEHKVTRTECVTGGGVSFYGGTGAWRDDVCTVVSPLAWCCHVPGCCLTPCASEHERHRRRPSKPDATTARRIKYQPTNCFCLAQACLLVAAGWHQTATCVEERGQGQ